MEQLSKAASPFAIKNVRLFIAFRIFFNARFYYPVFTILFLDFGLTMAQFALTFRAGRWILDTPFALVIICAGFLFNSIMRMVITLSSQYYRVIQVPEALFGVIGSAIAVLGLIIPRIALRMSERHSPRHNLLVLAGVTLVGLVGMTFFTPLAGLVPAVILFSAMYMTGFFVSHYLNQITDSVQRATVLSFKGLSYNLAYGVIGLLYSLLVAWTRPEIIRQHPAADPQVIENLVFKGTFGWFPGVFLAGLVIFFWFAARTVFPCKTPGNSGK